MCEFTGVATLVAGGVGAADDVLGILLEGGFDRQQFLAADHAALHAVLGHQRGGAGGRVKGLLVHVEVGNAFLQAVVFNAGGRDDFLQRAVAVGAQRDELLYVALKGRVIAVG